MGKPLADVGSVRSHADPRRDTVRVAVSTFVAGVAAALVVAPVVGAPLGPIDDHQIVEITRQGISLATYVAHAVEASRLRPAYWLGILIEAAVWGTNPAGWLLDRFLLAVATILLACAIAGRWVLRPIALLAGIVLVAGPQAEAWYRFGPQEAYAMPLLLGAVLAMLQGRIRLALGLAVVLALTKEPFVVPAVVIVLWAWRRGARRDAFVVALPIVATAVIVGWLAVTTPTLANREWSDPRYLLPWIAMPIALVVWVTRPHRLVPLAIFGIWLAIAMPMGLQEGLRWGLMNRQFAADLETVHAAVAAHPEALLLVEATVDDYELAVSFRTWVPEGSAELRVAPGSGFLWSNLSHLSVNGGHGYLPLRPSTGPTLVLELMSARVIVLGTQ